MSSFKPTPEQEAIVAAAKDTTDNLIVSALAGAAKTSTLVLIANALPKISILCLAFNKKIAVEMQERLPPNCVAMTLNALGHRVWAQFLNKRVVLDASKTFKIVKEIVNKLPTHEKDEAVEAFTDIMQAVDSGKTCGYIPTNHFPHAKGLMNDEEFFNWMDEPPSLLMERIIREATIESIKQGLQGVIDFNDQILLPTVFPASFPQYPLVMVDETQDLSALNHATLRKLARKRLMAVGDENQSIYGFRGAHQDSMQLLRQTFNMRPLILSTSFRCPQAVVREAQWRAPHMRYPEWAKEGEVRSLKEWDKATVPDGAAIICRNNAPLFSLAVKLLKHGRYPQLIGNDIGKYLVKVMKKFGKPDLPRARVELAIAAWAEEKLKKHRNPAKVHDQVACLKIFAEQATDLGGAIAYAEHLFNTQGPVLLMTGHKSKGLEFDEVFILDRELVRLGDDQENNLLYVMQTRAKQRLTYVESKTFFDEYEDQDAEDIQQEGEAA